MATVPPNPQASPPQLPPPRPSPSPAFEYTKALFANTNEWYKDAHTRAQAALTLDGTFVTILAGLIVLKADDLTTLVSGFNLPTRVALIIMALTFLFSFGFALSALVPRDMWHAESLYTKTTSGKDPPIPEVMWWSQFIRQMAPADFIKYSGWMSEELHRQALAAQIFELSRRLKWKYRCVFVAQLLAGVALMALLVATVLYVVDHS